MTDIRGRMGTRYDQALWNRVRTEPQPAATPAGKSGFFARPQTGLDPRIVDPKTNRVWPKLRDAVLRTLYDFWSKRYRDPRLWSTVWIAGSALSHQWAADRGTADLDILIGVNHQRFVAANPAFVDLDPDVIDSRFNKEFDNELEPFTKKFLGAYEMTMFVNPGAEDIRAINPYAAYDLTNDRWTVDPIELGADWDPLTYFPKDWWDRVSGEVDRVKVLVSRYHELRRKAEASAQDSPGWVNALAGIKRTVIPQATALFDDIHKSRTLAFSPGGGGYKDYNNFRWQVGKRAGIIEALHALKAIDVHAHIENQQRIYGEALLDSHAALLQAELWNTPYRDIAVEFPSTGSAAPQEDSIRLVD